MGDAVEGPGRQILRQLQQYEKVLGLHESKLAQFDPIFQNLGYGMKICEARQVDVGKCSEAGAACVAGQRLVIALPRV